MRSWYTLTQINQTKSLLLLFPGPYWPGVVVSVKISSMGQRDLLGNFLYYLGILERK